MSVNAPGAAGVPASLDVPLTQQTAPVLEYRCLYTSDIRKKVKKWQDGRLKFHTFNKKIMVWDERSYFIGETYWRDDAEFGDGEELRLERNGTLVEVGECIGKYETDLTDLVGKRVKEREERAAAKIATGTPRKYPTAFVGNQETPGSVHLRPKSLNAVLTPTGHYGRALMPDTSPFEDRRRLANVIPQHEENERPAKRRKQESPPSKSGYAQNLMGTKITLTSSRPPSTASIHYEPVRVRPLQKPPAPTIDLTTDGDGGNPQTIIKKAQDNITKNNRPAIIQQRRRPSPKPKTSYASNLTGAALTLSRPSDFSQRRTKPTVQANDNPTTNKHLQSTLFISSDTDNNSSDIELPVERRATMIEKTKRLTVDGLQSLQENTPRARLSSPSLEVMAPSVGPGHTLQKRSTFQSSIIDPSPDHTTSTLRIKSRPPKKMMMLMDRPSSRPSGTKESCVPKRPTLRPPDPPSNDPILSQATIQLDAFCKKQEAALKARLNRRQPQLASADLSSSSTDSGIDHQTIDQLLTRKSTLQLNGSCDAAELGVKKKTLGFLGSLDVCQGIGYQGFGLDVDTDISLKSASIGRVHGLPAIVQQKNFATPSNFVPSDGENNRQSEPSLNMSLQTINESKHEASEAAPEGEYNRTAIPNFPSAETEADSTSPRNESAEISRLANSILRPTHSTRSEPLPPINSLRTEDGTTDDISNEVQSATDQLRAIIKASASPVTQVEKLAPDKSENSWQTSANPNSESNSQQPAVKSLPESLPNSQATTILGGAVLDLATVPIKVSESRNPERVQLNKPKPTLPQVRLANPATRGKSLQSVTAITLDALNPMNVMGPPQPRILSRGEKAQVREDAANRTDIAGVREEAPGGPWSREAFDLFGSGRPLERAA